MKLIFLFILTTNFCWLNHEPPFEIKTEKIDGKRYFSFESDRRFEVNGIEVIEIINLKPNEYVPHNPIWSVDIRMNYESYVIFQGRFEYGDNFESFIEKKALSKTYTSIQAKPLIEGKKYKIGIGRYQPVRGSILEFVH